MLGQALACLLALAAAAASKPSASPSLWELGLEEPGGANPLAPNHIPCTDGPHGCDLHSTVCLKSPVYNLHTCLCLDGFVVDEADLTHCLPAKGEDVGSYSPANIDIDDDVPLEVVPEDDDDMASLETMIIPASYSYSELSRDAPVGQDPWIQSGATEDDLISYEDRVSLMVKAMGGDEDEVADSLESVEESLGAMSGSGSGSGSFAETSSSGESQSYSSMEAEEAVSNTFTASLVLQGVSKAEFGAAEQLSFRQAVAVAAALTIDQVSIDSVVDARRRLQAGDSISVTFTMHTDSEDQGINVQHALESSTFFSSLTAELESLKVIEDSEAEAEGDFSFTAESTSYSASGSGSGAAAASSEEEVEEDEALTVAEVASYASFGSGSGADAPEEIEDEEPELTVTEGTSYGASGSGSGAGAPNKEEEEEELPSTEGTSYDGSGSGSGAAASDEDVLVEDDDGSCVDSDWISATSATCADYSTKEWCTLDGGYGPGWDTGWGSFALWGDTSGTDATAACCACGGGSHPTKPTASAAATSSSLTAEGDSASYGSIVTVDSYDSASVADESDHESNHEGGGHEADDDAPTDLECTSPDGSLKAVLDVDKSEIALYEMPTTVEASPLYEAPLTTDASSTATAMKFNPEKFELFLTVDDGGMWVVNLETKQVTFRGGPTHQPTRAPTPAPESVFPEADAEDYDSAWGATTTTFTSYLHAPTIDEAASSAGADADADADYSSFGASSFDSEGAADAAAEAAAAESAPAPTAEVTEARPTLPTAETIEPMPSRAPTRPGLFRRVRYTRAPTMRPTRAPSRSRSRISSSETSLLAASLEQADDRVEQAPMSRTNGVFMVTGIAVATTAMLALAFVVARRKRQQAGVWVVSAPSATIASFGPGTAPHNTPGSPVQAQRHSQARPTLLVGRERSHHQPQAGVGASAAAAAAAAAVDFEQHGDAQISSMI